MLLDILPTRKSYFHPKKGDSIRFVKDGLLVDGYVNEVADNFGMIQYRVSYKDLLNDKTSQAVLDYNSGIWSLDSSTKLLTPTQIIEMDGIPEYEISFYKLSRQQIVENSASRKK